MFPALFFPATCELCGHWIPQHAANCPRNGVHPSQWSFSVSSTEYIVDGQVTNSYHALNQNHRKLRDAAFLGLTCGSGTTNLQLDADYNAWV